MQGIQPCRTFVAHRRTGHALSEKAEPKDRANVLLGWGYRISDADEEWVNQRLSHNDLAENDEQDHEENDAEGDRKNDEDNDEENTEEDTEEGFEENVEEDGYGTRNQVRREGPERMNDFRNETQDSGNDIAEKYVERNGESSAEDLNDLDDRMPEASADKEAFEQVATTASSPPVTGSDSSTESLSDLEDRMPEALAENEALNRIAAAPNSPPKSTPESQKMLDDKRTVLRSHSKNIAKTGMKRSAGDVLDPPASKR